MWRFTPRQGDMFIGEQDTLAPFEGAEWFWSGDVLLEFRSFDRSGFEFLQVADEHAQVLILLDWFSLKSEIRANCLASIVHSPTGKRKTDISSRGLKPKPRFYRT